MSPSAIDNVVNAIAPSTAADAKTHSNPLFSLAGKTIAITGGGRGLGLTLAAAVIEAGGHAACLDILPEPSNTEWAELAKIAKQTGTQISYRRCDVTSEAEFTEVLAQISQEGDDHGASFGGMIACAGIQQKVPALESEASDFERILRVNVVGAFISVKRAARILKDKGTGGSIVLIASMSGQVANRVGVSLDHGMGLSNILTRALHAPHTTQANQPSTRCADHLHRSGANMVSG